MADKQNGSIILPIAKAPYEVPAAILNAELAAICERRSTVRREASAETQGGAASGTKAEGALGEFHHGNLSIYRSSVPLLQKILKLFGNVVSSHEYLL